MTETSLPRIGGVFLVLAIFANVMAFAIGTSRGLLPPPAFDFGDSQHLLQLSAESGSHLLPLTLSLLSPVLALPVGFAFFHVLKPAGWPAAFGAAMFFVGMIFVVLLDVLEFIAVARLAPAYGAAPDVARPAIAIVGGLVDSAIDVLGLVGHFFSFGLAQLAFGVAIIKIPNISNWLGGLSFVPAIMIGWMVPLLAFFGQAVGLVVGIGMVMFFVWLAGMAVVLFRWNARVA